MAKVLEILAILALLAMDSVMAAAPSCQTVSSKLNPCTSYIEGSGSPSNDCCSGVKNIASQVKGKPDLVSICNCVKGMLAKLGKVDPGRISELPKKCGVAVNFPPIDKNYDCSKI